MGASAFLTSKAFKMGFFWADAPKPPSAVVAPLSSAPPPSCPMHKSSDSSAVPYPPRQDSPQSIPFSCPVSQNSNSPLKPNHPQPSASASESSKAQHAPSISSTLSKLNPLNYMPSLSNTRPSDSPAEDVESMVAVHNFLNEGAWREIEEWERIFSPGLAHAWSICSRGEQGIALERAKHDFLA